MTYADVCPISQPKTIVKHLIQVFSNFGYPRILQSDNGSEFKNVTVKLLTESTGIDHRLTTPYHPRANGSAERWVQEKPIPWIHLFALPGIS